MTSKLTITDERLAELVAFKPLPGTDITSATRDEWMAMAAELQERRKADSEPVAYMYDGEDGREYNGHNEFSGGGKGIPLYRHAQQPVVLDGLISAVNRLLDSDGSRGCYSAIRCHDARAEVERLLAAAPQEVKGE